MLGIGSATQSQFIGSKVILQPLGDVKELYFEVSGWLVDRFQAADL